MDLFDKIVRIPNNLEKDVDLELYLSIDNDRNKIYGLSIFYRGATEWKSYIGTFQFLYGIYVGSSRSNKIIDKIDDDLIKSKMNLDNDFHGVVSFDIDPNNKPINIIKSFKITRDTGLNFLFKSDDEKEIIFISYLYDQYENQYDNEEEYFECKRLSKLIFKK